MSEVPNKTTHAQRRREERKEALRQELSAREYLRQLHRIDCTLRKKWRKLGNEQIAAMRLRADIQFRRLAKVLPDLKAIEHSGETTQRHVIELTREELLVIASGGREGDFETGRSDSDPAGVH